MTPSDFKVDEVGSVAPATSTELIVDANRSWLAVPGMMASDLSAFRRRWFVGTNREPLLTFYTSLLISRASENF